MADALKYDEDELEKQQEDKYVPLAMRLFKPPEASDSDLNDQLKKMVSKQTVNAGEKDKVKGAAA